MTDMEFLKKELAVAEGDEMFTSAEHFRSIVAKLVMIDDIDLLRAEEGDLIEIISDNPDFNGLPCCMIDVFSEWLPSNGRRYYGESLPAVLRKAAGERKADSEGGKPSK